MHKREGIEPRYLQKTVGADVVSKTEVVYLLAADNDHRPLLTRLSAVNQPVIRAHNPFSRPQPAGVAYI